MRNRRRSLFLVCGLCVALGCSRGPSAGPAVIAADSLVMMEPDAEGLFMPLRTQVRLPDGGLLADIGTAVDQFDREGRFVRRIGRSGSGPGEFQRISTILTLPGDSLFAAVDARRGRIAVFAIADGSLVREVPIRPFFPGQQWRWIGDTVVMPGKLSPTPFTSWVPATDSIWSWGTVPEIYHTSLGAYTQGGEPSLTPRGAGWLAVYPADPRVFVLDRAGTPERSVILPTRLRKGVPPAVGDSVAAIGRSGIFRYAASLVFALWELRNGDYLVIHMDTDPHLDEAVYAASRGAGGITYENMRYWVSILSRDLTRACVDTPVPLESDNMIEPFLRADTLYFLTRAVATDSQALAVVHPFTIDDRGCDWMPTDGGQ